MTPSVGRVSSVALSTSTDATRPGALASMNNNHDPLLDIFTPDDLTAALWRAHSLRRLHVTGAVPREAHHCDDADQALMVLLMCTGNPEDIAEEAQWAAIWYRTLLATFSRKWEINPWVLHRRLTGGVYLDIHPSLGTPREDEEDDDDGF
jgi:hypothetical protein